MIFNIGENPYRIDFMNFIANVEYEKADLTKISAVIDGIRLPIIHYNDLISTKEISCRLKYLADVEELKKINKKWKMHITKP